MGLEVKTVPGVDLALVDHGRHPLADKFPRPAFIDGRVICGMGGYDGYEHNGQKNNKYFSDVTYHGGVPFSIPADGCMCRKAKSPATSGNAIINPAFYNFTNNWFVSQINPRIPKRGEGI